MNFSIIYSVSIIYGRANLTISEESPDSMSVSNIFRDRCQCELEGSDLLEKRATESYTA